MSMFVYSVEKLFFGARNRKLQLLKWGSDSDVVLSPVRQKLVDKNDENRDFFSRAYRPEYFSTEPEYLNIIF